MPCDLQCEIARQTAGASTLLSVCIPHCVLAYSLEIPSSPVYVNTNFDSFFVNYHRAGVIIPKDKRMRGNGYKICPFFYFSCELNSGNLTLTLLTLDYKQRKQRKAEVKP